MKEDKKQQIAQLAAEIFYKKGYTNTSINDVLKASKLTKGGFYYYFSSKEELAEAVIDYYYSILEGFFVSIEADKELSPVEKIKDFITSYSQLHIEFDFQGSPIGVLAQELSNINEKFRKQLLGVFNLLENRFAKFIEEAQKIEELPNYMDSKDIAEVLVSYLEGILLLSKTKKSEETIEKAIKYLDFLLQKN